MGGVGVIWVLRVVDADCVLLVLGFVLIGLSLWWWVCVLVLFLVSDGYALFCVLLVCGLGFLVLGLFCGFGFCVWGGVLLVVW